MLHVYCRTRPTLLINYETLVCFGGGQNSLAPSISFLGVMAGFPPFGSAPEYTGEPQTLFG